MDFIIPTLFLAALILFVMLVKQKP